MNNNIKQQPYYQVYMNSKSSHHKQAAETTSGLGVKSLQKGLNELYKDDYDKQLLKEDNILGPKTTSRMKEALAKIGANDVNKSIKLGGFSNILEEHRKQPVDQQILNNTMTTIRPKDGGIFLQQNLNKVGAGLKEDNYIGPKTTAAFNQGKDDNEDALKEYARENIEKEIEKTQEMEERERLKELDREEKEKEKERERMEKEEEKERLEEQEQEQEI